MAESQQVTTRNGNAPYLVYYEKTVVEVTCAQSPLDAINNICHRCPELDNPEKRLRMSALVLTDELYKKEKSKIKRKRNRKVKVPWQPLLFGKPFGKYPTMAVSKKQARCNRGTPRKNAWNTRRPNQPRPCIMKVSPRGRYLVTLPGNPNTIRGKPAT